MSRGRRTGTASDGIGGEEDDDRRQVEPDEEQDPAAPPPREVRLGAVGTERDRVREDQVEVHETGRQEHQRERSGLEHQEVDPAVRRRPEAADQEEEKEGADQVVDLGGAECRLPPADEETDGEEGKAEQAGEEVGRAADEPPPEAHRHLFEPRGAPQQVRDLVADLAPRQEPAGVLARGENGPVDAGDPVAGLDAGRLGARARNHLADRERPPAVGFEHDAVVRPRHQDVGDREQRKEQSSAPENGDQRR